MKKFELVSPDRYSDGNRTLIVEDIPSENPKSYLKEEYVYVIDRHMLKIITGIIKESNIRESDINYEFDKESLFNSIKIRIPNINKATIQIAFWINNLR